jgi:hypothetical protein
VVKRRSSHRQRRSVHADRDSTRQRCVASGRSRRVGSRSPSQTLGLSPLGTHCRERIGISIVSHQLQLLSRRRQPSLGPGVPRALSWIRKMANRCGNGKSLWHTIKATFWHLPRLGEAFFINILRAQRETNGTLLIFPLLWSGGYFCSRRLALFFQTRIG